jgi:hypothetical protein
MMENYRQQQEQEERQQWIVYDKLQHARVTLQSIELKKSGHNKFAGYRYFELADFLPTVNKIFNEEGLCHTLEFTSDLAVMRIFDTENGGCAKFTCPMAEANLKGCHPVQNLGASITYITRYLLVMAMAIVEHDAIDASEPIPEDKKSSKSETIPEEKKSGKSVSKDVFDHMSAEDKEQILSFAMQVNAMALKNDIEGAIDYINELQLDADWKTALWSQLDSKIRSAIKKFTTR